MLAKFYEASGGREGVDVDFVELTKREGYYPSINDIVSHLKGEGWATEGRQNVLRLTHWGIAEYKRSASARPDAARVVERESKRLLNEVRSLAVRVEEFIAEPSAKGHAELAKSIDGLSSILAEIKTGL